MFVHRLFWIKLAFSFPSSLFSIFFPLKFWPHTLFPFTPQIPPQFTFQYLLSFFIIILAEWQGLTLIVRECPFCFSKKYYFEKWVSR